MNNINKIIQIMEAVFAAMLPEYTGNEKSLELYLINSDIKELEKLSIKYNINIEEVVQ